MRSHALDPFRMESSCAVKGYCGSFALLVVLAVTGCSMLAPPSSSPTPDLVETPLANTPSPSVPAPTPTQVPSPTPTGTPPPLVPLKVSLSWRFPTLETVWALTTADLDGDGDKEVVAGSYDKHVYALDHDGSLIWRYQTGGPVYCLDTGDLDGDDGAEVVVGGDDNTVHAVDTDGSPLWEQYVGSRVVAVDVTSDEEDGRGKVLVGCQDGQILALGPDGDILWRIHSETGLAFVKWVDPDGDGRHDGLAVNQNGAVSLIGADGKARWSHDTGAHVRESRVYDLDADGVEEVVVGSADGWLHVLSATGNEVWKRHLSAPVVTVDIGDVDGDGRGEVVAGTGGSAPGISLLDHDGWQSWTYQVLKGVWAVRTLDVDADGRGEVLAGGDDGNVRILDTYGRLLGGYQTGRRLHGLWAGDTSEDGFTDIVVRSGNDVCLLTVSVPGVRVEDLETIREPATLPSWEGRLPGVSEASEEDIELVFVGDLLLSRTVEERMEVFGSQYPFQAVADVLRGADITIGNLEAPLTVRGDPLNKRFVFRADPAHADGLAWAGFDLLSLANNHLLDFEVEGLSQTLETLEGRGISYVGAGLSYEEAHRPLIKQVKGKRIAFLSYAATRWEGSYELPTTEMVSFADLSTITDEVRRAKQVADLVVVIMHVGTEYQVAPDAEQLAVSRTAIDAGASLVIGHHSHVVQSTVAYQNGLIVYGLGNFVFDIDTVEGARQGAILRVLVGEAGVESADLVPVRIVDDVQPQLMAGEDGSPVVTPVFSTSLD
jgi:poly-gamma-glutamate capsule biosynthesis protein CapA/YwtB (metallophosphatase superfamily)